MNGKPQIPPRPQHANRTIIMQYVISAVLLGLTLLAWFTTDLPTWERVVRGLQTSLVRVIQGLLNPDLELLPLAFSSMNETLFMAILGTFLGAVLALPLAFIAASNLVGGNAASFPGKTVLVAIRTFPEIILALIFVAAAGPGPTAGIMAMGIHSIGFLGKVFADIIEGIDPGPSEAIRAAGGSRVQVFFYAVIPQAIPEIISLVLYRFEINLRNAAILGMVGAGGIGIPLIQRINFRRWDEVATLLFMMIIYIIVVDALSSRIRRRLV